MRFRFIRTFIRKCIRRIMNTIEHERNGFFLLLFYCFFGSESSFLPFFLYKYWSLSKRFATVDSPVVMWAFNMKMNQFFPLKKSRLQWHFSVGFFCKQKTSVVHWQTKCFCWIITIEERMKTFTAYSLLILVNYDFLCIFLHHFLVNDDIKSTSQQIYQRNQLIFILFVIILITIFRIFSKRTGRQSIEWRRKQSFNK